MPDESVLVHLVGDVGPRRIEYGEDPCTLFAAARSRLRKADIRFCQLERTLSTNGTPQIYATSAWFGQVHPDNVRCLVDGGFDVVSLAGNHAGDHGFGPLLETVDLVRKNGILPTGAGKNLAEACQPAVLERKGVKVAFLSYCSILPKGLAAGPNKPGVAPIEVATYYEPLPEAYHPGIPPKIVTIAKADHVAAMVAQIRQAKQVADVVIVSLHYGIPWVPGLLAQYQPVVSYAAIDAGADLIFGHHPHVMKGIEVYKGRVIFYSAGDFAQETPHQERKNDDVTGTSIFNIKEFQQAGSRPENDPAWARFMGPRERRYSMIAACLIKDKKVARVSFHPVGINQRAEPEPLTADDSRWNEVVGFVVTHTKPFGTKLAIGRDEVVIEID
jgi:poly-gamma-glutamate synthesis protein (capsule biosynthesis protein)